MGQITLTIDGREVKGEEGDTILQVCQKNGIDVPTLCHFDGLTDIGVCRMCLVEIVGKRVTLNPACTTPAADGMVVRTDSDNLRELRRNILELLFSERNHYCMFCEMSGDCELQSLAYRLGVDHIKYPFFYPRFPLDSSNPYIIMEHNRCVLCRRCVRACAELVGNHTLGLRERGARTMINADLDVPFGDSSCVLCGVCVQVCPTGALLDRKSAYLGREAQLERVKSTCAFCSVGCGIEILTRSNHVVRVEGDWEAEPNRGLLCVRGRFEPLYERRKRLLTPLVRRNGRLEEAEWDEALEMAAQGLRRADRVGGLATGMATSETLGLFVELFRKLGSDNLGLLEGTVAPPADEVPLSELDKADFFLVVGVDLTRDHQVAGFFVKRGVANRGARLILIDGADNGLAPYAHYKLSPSQVDRAISLCQAAARPIVLYGAEAGEAVERLGEALKGKAGFIALAPGSNGRGALTVGLDGAFQAQKAQAVYVLAGEAPVNEATVGLLREASFLVVHATYHSALTEKADVVLPALIWAERTGTFINTEGRTLKLTQAIQPPPEVKDEGEVLKGLIDML